jgi:hypothetical protein
MGIFMPQMVLPFFPKDVTFINNSLAFCCNENEIHYFYQGPNPVFTHSKSDVQTFRMIVSQFYVTGKATQSEICRAFAIPAITLKRSVKLYREQGPAAFYQPVVRIRGPRILTNQILDEAEKLLSDGKTLREVSKKLSIKYDTLYRAIKDGKLKKKL